MFDIALKNKITFNRIDDNSIYKYKISVKEYIPNSGIKEYILKEINNPTQAMPIKRKIEFSLNSDNIYILPIGKIFVSINYPIEIYVDGVNKLKQEMFKVDINKNLVEILYDKLDDYTFIRIEYYIDAIEFVHNTTNKCEYEIIPILDQSKTKIGVHTKII